MPIVMDQVIDTLNGTYIADPEKVQIGVVAGRGATNYRAHSIQTLITTNTTQNISEMIVSVTGETDSTSLNINLTESVIVG